MCLELGHLLLTMAVMAQRAAHYFLLPLSQLVPIGPSAQDMLYMQLHALSLDAGTLFFSNLKRFNNLGELATAFRLIKLEQYSWYHIL